MKKRILSGLLSLCLILLSAPAVWRTGISAEAPGETDAPWNGEATTPPEGSGTETDPYRIGTAAEFAWMNTQMTTTNKTYFSGTYFVLTADIDCNGKQLRIGTSSKSFGGVFDGKGYTVRNTHILLNLNVSPTGLFAYVKGGTVKNLNVAASSVSTIAATDNGEKGTAGMIVGFLESGNLTGCTVDENCFVSATCYVGGLVGKAQNSNISYCVSNASVTVAPNDATKRQQKFCLNFSVGGILGWSMGGNTVAHCSNYGKVALENISEIKSGTNILCAGGIVGYHTAGDSVTDSYNSGAVTGVETLGSRISVGAVIGRSRTAPAVTVERCYNLSQILSVSGKGNRHVGLLVGYVNTANILTAKDCMSVAVDGIDNGLDNSIVIQANGAIIAENNKIATAEEIAVPVAGIQAKIKANRVARLALIGLQTTEAVGGVYSVRILLGLDHLDYAYYKIVTTATYEKDGVTQTANNGGKPLTVAYDTVYAAGEPVSAVRFGSDYLGAIVLSEVPADTAIAFVIRAYVGDAAGNETLVDSVTCQIGNQ